MGAKESTGGMYIELEANSVVAGQVITGLLHILVTTPIPATGLSLCFKGVEKTRWTVHKATCPTGPTPNLFTGRRILIRQNYHLHEASQGALQPGQYSFPFLIKTPSDLPSSFSCTLPSESAPDHPPPRGVIQYSLVAKVPGMAKTKQELFVTQQIYKEVAPTEDEVVANISTWCCWGRGVVRMRADFSKNAYVPGENATVVVDMHNEQSRVKSSGLRLVLFRQVRIRDTEGHSKTAVERIAAVKSSLDVAAGPNLLSAGKHSVVMLIPPAEKVDRTVTVRSTLIDCEYFLRTEAVMDGRWMCCGEMPAIEKRMVVYQPQHQDPSEAPADKPEDWSPRVMPLCKFDAAVGLRYPHKTS